MNTELKKLRQSYPINSRGTKSDWRHVASTRHLTRIIIYLSNVDYANKTKICMDAKVEHKKLNDALHFLLNHKIISIIKIRTRTQSYTNHYVLNPLFKQK